MQGRKPLLSVDGFPQFYYVFESPRRGATARHGGFWLPVHRPQQNLIMYDWSTIVAQLLRGAPNGLQYAIGGMYFEFDNSGSPVNPVPAYGRGDTLAYYDGLNSGNPDRDYLRVPLISTSLSTTDETNFPYGNKVTFWAQTAGATGVHGNTFSDAANSRFYGAALVSFVDPNDSTQDLIFSRLYKASGEQIDKIAGAQIGASWNISLV